MVSTRSNDLKRAALLRERILGCLRAAPAAMSIAEVCSFAGIVELYHTRLLPQKVAVQMRALAKQGLLTKTDPGQYVISKKGQEPAPSMLQELHLEVSKRDQQVSFIFGGLRVTVKILP
jgi:hypothetical protein